MVVALLLASGALSSAQAVLPKGDICFNVNITEFDGITIAPGAFTFVAKMHLEVASGSSIGQVVGSGTVLGGTVIMTGTYFKLGTKIYLNLTLTQTIPDGAKSSGVMQAVLNGKLKGTFYLNRNDILVDKTTQTGYYKGTMAPLAICP